MGSAPWVLILDDGELDDIQQMLDELAIPCARIRGGAIVHGTPAPRDLLVATPRRIEAVSEAVEDAENPPIRVMVVNEDSNALRSQLRRSGFDYLVRRPVHEEALRLLLLHCVYKGEERRQEPRVAVGFEVSFRSGLLTRNATLADLSIRGCRLLSETRVEPGRRIRVQIPEALETGDPFSVTGRVVRIEDAQGRGTAPVTLAVSFEKLDEEVRQALELIIEDRAIGPATLRPRGPEAGRNSSTPGEREGGGDASPLRVELSMQPDSESEERGEGIGGSVPHARERPATAPDEDRRRGPRASYAQTVPAFGSRALRVLVGRDLSSGGMRIEKLPGLELGDRLHLALYGEPREKPILVWGTVARDDGAEGVAIVFDPIGSASAARLERLIGSLPAVESLHHSEIQAMGTVVSEILD